MLLTLQLVLCCGFVIAKFLTYSTAFLSSCYPQRRINKQTVAVYMLYDVLYLNPLSEIYKKISQLQND